MPWLLFLALTRGCFSLTSLSYSSAWGHCPPQPVPLLRHTPFPSLLLLLIGPDVYLYKYPSNLVPPILLLLLRMTCEDGTNRVL